MFTFNQSGLLDRVWRKTFVWVMLWGMAAFQGRGQGALDEIGFDVLVPPGGLLADGTPADYPVQPGDLLLSLIESPTNMFSALMNEDAELFWAHQSPFRGFYMKPWGPGEFVWYNYTLRKWTVVDDEFTPLDTLTQSFTYDDDYHDVHRFDDGSYMVVMLQHLDMDLSDMGGSVNSEILNPYMVHLDSEENILREWSGLDHFPLDPAIDNLDWVIVDYLHWNAFQIDEFGGLLMSFRNRSQIVRLRPEDWTVHWKFGGSENQFVTTDPGWNGFNYQHDVHPLDGGRILFFDNGIYNENGYLSRAVEFHLDTVNFVAENVWHFSHPDGVYGAAQGSAIRLDNGNTLIGWGTAGTPQYGTQVTEVTPEGNIAFDVRFTDGATLYRARKYPEDMLMGCRLQGAVNYTSSSWLLAQGPCYYDVDEDGDGWTDLAGDCNDDNASVYPGALEIANDGVDQDCDGLDAVGGCLDESATNFDAEATIDDGACLYHAVFRVDLALQENPAGNVWDLMACELWITDSTDVAFENASVVLPSNAAWQVAQFTLQLGEGAWRYRFARPDGLMEIYERFVTVQAGGGDLDLGAVCFDLGGPCPGCTDPMDFAYNPWSDSESMCQGWAVMGCTYLEAVNFQGGANWDNGTCIFDAAPACPGDFDGDGSVTVSDLMDMLASLGSVCM